MKVTNLENIVTSIITWKTQLFLDDLCFLMHKNYYSLEKQQVAYGTCFEIYKSNTISVCVSLEDVVRVQHNWATDRYTPQY